MRVGIVCSGGGSAYAAAADILARAGVDMEFLLVTDRCCGAEEHAKRLGHAKVRIVESDQNRFSQGAADWFLSQGEVAEVWLLFTRLVGAPLHQRLPCYNIHPSLLPVFPGFGAVSAALKSGSRFLGATAHVVNSSVDSGPIIAQVVAPIASESRLDDLQRLSFAQKVYLLLALSEIGRNCAPGSDPPSLRAWANPALRNPQLVLQYALFLQREGINWPGCSGSDQ